MTTTVLQVSDPHFGTERPEVCRALEDLAHELAPDLGVLSGDITQRATAAQFEAARRFVERLELPHWLVIPGNHDLPLWNLPLRLAAPYARFARAFGAEREPVWRNGDLLLVGVDATRWWRHKHGTLDEAQVARIAGRLRGAPAGCVRGVVVHQPLAVRRPQDRVDLARGHAQALAAWSAAGADVVLCGHIHLSDVLAVHRETRTLPRPLWLLQAGTAVSSRVRPPSGHSVNVLRCAGGCGEAQAERWDYAPARERFVRIASFPLRFGPPPAGPGPQRPD